MIAHSRSLTRSFAALVVITAITPLQAQEKGCIKGAIIGGIAGHMAGHGKLGAAAGCVVGTSRGQQGAPKRRTAATSPPK